MGALPGVGPDRVVHALLVHVSLPQLYGGEHFAKCMANLEDAELICCMVHNTKLEPKSLRTEHPNLHFKSYTILRASE
jgi:hypothetical protein